MNNHNLSWPGFLDLLDSHPEKGLEEFYLFVARLLRTSPPRLMNSLSEEDKEDLIQNIVIHCIQDNFRVLRTYKNEGNAFAAWLYFIARNKIIDFLRKSGREAKPKISSNPGALRQSNVTSGNREDFGDAVYVVRKCLEKMDEYCRVLLKMAADEFLPREMVMILGWPAEKAKKVSNDLGYCRKKLSKILSENGLKIEDYF